MATKVGNKKFVYFRFESKGFSLNTTRKEDCDKMYETTPGGCRVIGYEYNGDGTILCEK